MLIFFSRYLMEEIWSGDACSWIPSPPSFWAKTHPIKYISGDEEPGEGLPNLGDSPVSSSYSELRQVSLGLRQVVLGFWLSFVSLSG